MALDAYFVKSYGAGCDYPTVINPCRNEEEANTLANRIRERCKARDWNMTILVERNPHNDHKSWQAGCFYCENVRIENLKSR